MNVAFYYHITVYSNQGKIFLPSYLGVFIDSLASEVKQLTIVMHEASENEYEACDYSLKASNIKWLNLGLKTPAWHRTIFFKQVLKKKLDAIKNCDYLIIRSPSPLAPFFNYYFKKSKLCFLVVGDYEEAANNMTTLSIRDKAIKYFLKISNKLLEYQMKSTDVIVNSPALYSKYEKKAKSIFLIKTTTITTNDFFYRNDTCQDSEISILYTGSINPLKGLIELVEATSMLVFDGYNIKTIIVGKELSIEKTFQNELIEKSIELNIKERLFFYGFKTVGAELNKVYRNADIYAIPSYHEGFPRTIWEAMANGLPVVASNVGAIPFYLKNEHSVLLVKPRDARGLYLALKKVIDNKKLRQELIINGQELAKEAIQEKQINLLVSRLYQLTKFNN